MLREGFDVEGVSSSWTIEIQDSLRISTEGGPVTETTHGTPPNSSFRDSGVAGALSAYEDTIQDPRHSSLLNGPTKSQQAGEMENLGTQEFLASQLEVIERLKADEEQSQDGKTSKGAGGGSTSGGGEDGNGVIEEKGRVNEHIGPVQFNMGGIQVDAEDMLKRLKDRGTEGTPDRNVETPASPEGKSQNEALASFFAGLMKRGGSSSPRTAHH